MRNFKIYSLLFIIGGLVYSLIEILYRGYTHWTMSITGGLCLCLLYKIQDIFGLHHIIKKCVLGTFVITTLEFLIGCIVNIDLNWDIWDYSSIPLNLMGQICLPFSIAWFFICIPAFILCNLIKNKLFVKIK